MTQDTLKAVAKKAVKLAEAQGAKCVLVGTAALAMLGYAVDPPDLDFLVSEPIGRSSVDDYKSCPDVVIDGVKVQFIAAQDEGHRTYWDPKPRHVAGVPVAHEEYIIGLKRWKGREKDREFLRGWDAHSPA